MDIQKIKNRLDEIFKTYRIVFWNDPEGECENELTECLPEGVNILRPDKMGQLKIKVLIEIEKPEDKFLVYAPFIEPGYEEDWLLDIRLYSYQFYADTASMILEELGLQRHSLRDHIAKRKKYFANKHGMRNCIYSPYEYLPSFCRRKQKHYGNTCIRGIVFCFWKRFCCSVCFFERQDKCSS